MPPRCSSMPETLTPFLYSFLFRSGSKHLPILARQYLRSQTLEHRSSTSSSGSTENNEDDSYHLNHPPSDYSRSVFTDRATVTLYAGSGGHGCISFLREKYIAEGPPNGGDGGHGGNVYIQAIQGETSLHKLARRSIIKAGRGQNGQGKTRGGERGEDIIIQVPVGTVVREIDRVDPVEVEDERRALEAGKLDGENANGPYKWSREKWLLYPAITPEDIATAEFPTLPKGRRSHLSMAQTPVPVALDLSRSMDKPILLAAGAVGGLGNPHFVTRTVPRPKYATKGGEGMSITLSLELKLLADVGLVGLPNAGKSTLLRAMSNSRARVGDWAFTTLQPNIGTVVLDDNKGRPIVPSLESDGEPRTNFTIADIPGLVEDAHLDRGLGISFLRHIERARVLAFVIDLNAGPAVTALKALWKEVGQYERRKLHEDDQQNDEEDGARSNEELVKWTPFKATADPNKSNTIVITSGNSYDMRISDNTQKPFITRKPWFVVATKADLKDTQENFQTLNTYLKDLQQGHEFHPSGMKDGWSKLIEAIPVSAINGHGMERVRDWTVKLLDE